MKPKDLLILYFTLECKAKNLPLSEGSLSSFGWDQTNILSSQRRLQHLGLLEGQSLQPNFNRIQIFLLETLSFWWPSEAARNGKGLALSIPATSALSASTTQKSSLWVWPSEEGFAEGEVIDPLWPELPQICCGDRGLHEFFSSVEILRFDQHVAKQAAQSYIRRYLDNVQTLGAQHFPDIQQGFLELQDSQFEVLVGFICRNGFRALTLQKASLLTHIPVKYFFERWETDQALRLWIAGRYQEQVFTFLHPLLDQLHDINKGHLAVVLESFLDYVESNEDFYRITLWSYLEGDPAIEEMSRRSHREFFQAVMVLFRKSKPEAIERAEFYSYLFSSMWRLYADFAWNDSKCLKSNIDFPKLKNNLRNLIVRSIFEDF